MKRKFFAPSVAAAILAAGLSIGHLAAQQGVPQTNGSAVLRPSQTSSTSIAFADQSQTVPGLAGSKIGIGLAIPGLPDLERIQAESTWGMRTMPVPKYLRHAELGLAPNQGLLVTDLVPGLSAASAGIEPGSMILEIDGVPLLDNQPILPLQVEHKLVVLCDSGLKEICIKPFAENLVGAARAFEQMDSHGNLFSQVLPQLGLNSRGFPTAFGRSANSSAPRSLSVSEVNGEITVAAIVDGAEGPVRIQLQGCRTEIVSQLGQLPADVQAQLAPHIGL